MQDSPSGYRELAHSVSAQLASLRTSTPAVMKSFRELGRAATADGVLDPKTKELIALALSVAARCDPCIAFHMQTLVKLGARRQEIDETLGVTTYMDDAELDRNLAFIANSLKEGGKAVITFTNSHALDHWLRTLAKPLLSVFGRKDKVLTNLQIHPRSARQARSRIEKHLRVQDLVLLNQTVFPFSRMLPRPALALARRIATVAGTPAWKRWLSSDLLFRVGSS